MQIEAGKQVGPLYYMVKDVAVLEALVKQGAIRTSLKAEPQSKGGKKYHYVSFMRDLTKAGRNPGRWVYGIQIDGDKLSDRYKIHPYSFAGVAIQGNYYRLKTLTAYDNGTYKADIVNWPPIEIPDYLFKELESLIKNDPEGINEKKKLEVTTGSRAYRGRKALIRYNYNVKTGGPVLNNKTLSSEALNYLLKHTNLNETEERIWVVDDNVKYINIYSCITGYIAPEGDDAVEDAIKDGNLPDFRVMYY